MSNPPPVTIYTQPGCRPCARVKSLFVANGIGLEVVDITENEDARTYVVEVLRASSVPVVVTDDFDPVVGYQPDMYQQIIDRYGKGPKNGS